KFAPSVSEYHRLVGRTKARPHNLLSINILTARQRRLTASQMPYNRCVSSRITAHQRRITAPKALLSSLTSYLLSVSLLRLKKNV
ncbi:MAG: hypothetical protein PUC77_07220, partial [Bacteroidales bacterium]|nr:hypothetical protein [Bacteroidales bacterium]